MTREFRITSEAFNNIAPTSDDCYLSPEDPIHQLKAASVMGGLGSRAALDEYNSLQRPTIVGSDKGTIQREQNIKPGTQEWFELWFAKKGNK